MKFSFSIPTTPARIWTITFIYTSIVSLFIQLILLPYIFPSWHAGNGLISGTDASGFHEIAVRVMQDIKAQGWSAWQFRPDGSAPAGIASAIYALTLPKPWTLIPFGASLQAFAAVVLFLILRLITKNPRAAAVGIIPFLIFPSEISWYAQIHRDGMAILGFYCFLYAMILITVKAHWQRTNILKNFLQVLAYFLIGCFLIWIARAYQAKIFQALGIVFYLIMFANFLTRTLKRQMQPSALALMTLFFAFSLKFLGWVGTTEIMEFRNRTSSEMMSTYTRDAELDAENRERERAKKRANLAAKKSEESSAEFAESETDATASSESKSSVSKVKKVWRKKIAPQVNEESETDKALLDLYARAKVPFKPVKELTPEEVVRLMDYSRIEPVWNWSTLIPKKIDEQFYAIAQMRNRFRLTQPNASTAMDVDIAFHNTREVLEYIPRAFQIGFLAPFPVRDEKLKSERGSAMFRIVSLEMFAVYLGLMSFFFFWFKNPLRLDTLPILLYAGGTTVILGMVVNNVGTIYRMRFAFVMIFICLGIAQAFAARRIKVSDA